jgi:cobalt/nickel transport system permease protein
MNRGVIAKTLHEFTATLERTLVSEDSTHAHGLLQSLDPRVKLVGLLALVVSASLSRKLVVLAVLFGMGLALALASRLSLFSLAKTVWLVAFGFTFMIADPALFLVPGQALYKLPLSSLTITAQGLHGALLLIVRVETTMTLSALLVLTTPWMQLLKALRALAAPVEVIALLAMTHRYIVLLMETANAMFESRQSRMVGRLNGRQQRRLMVNTSGVLLSKTMTMGDQVFQAMQSRGFCGDVKLMIDFHLRRADYIAIPGFAVAVVATILAGR